MFHDLEPYPKYRPTGLPWLERTPSHWMTQRFKTVLRSIDLRSTTGEDELLTVSSARGVVPRASESVTMFKAASYVGHKLAAPGDLVINSLWAWGRGLGVSRYSGIVSTAYGVYRPMVAAVVNSGFLHLYVRSSPYNWELHERSRGVWTSRLQLTDERFLASPFVAPPPDEQAGIVTYLAHAHDRIDQAIATKRRLVALLRESRAQIIEKAIIEGGGDAERRRLKTVLSHIDQGVSPQAEAVLPGAGEWGVMKTGCVNDGVFRETESKRLPNEFKVPVEHRISVGDVLVSRASGSPRLVGSTARVTNLSLQLILSDKIFRLVPSDGLIDPEYLVRSMNAPFYRVQVLDAISGANGLANNLPRSRLREIRIPLPSIAEQREIVARIDAQTTLVNRQLNLATREVDLLEEFRKRLTADVVTGQLDVRNAAKKLQPVDPMEVVAMASATDDEDGEGGFADDEQEDE